jgi:outer membrane protein assembly factor BamB
MRTKLLLCTGTLASGLLLVTDALGADWLQFGYDAAHSGSNSAETTITAANVSQLISLYPSPITLPATVDSAPVYASNVVTPTGTRDLLFAFGSNNLYDGSSSLGTLLAIDAATGSVVWSKTTTGSSQHASSSPVIDPARQYVYSFGLDGYVHKYRIGDGVETLTSGPAGWPQRITLKPDAEKVASGLTIAAWNGTDYLEAVTNGYDGDGGDYQGHLVSINLGSGAHTVFNFMCSNVTVLLADGGCPSGREGGAWGRGGATFDTATGRIYVTSGNGNFNANSGGTNWGDSVLALAPDGTGSGSGVPHDSYTPSNYQTLEIKDTDLGSISLAILPVPTGSAVTHLGMQVGKDFQLRLINLDNMSGAHAPAHAGGELQILPVQQGGDGMREQPAVWVNPADGSTWLFIGNGNGLSGVQLGLNGSKQPVLSNVWEKSDSSTSATVANGVLYNAGSCNAGTCVVARNPLTGNVLWTSPPIGGVHWQSPILVNGALYITDSNARLWKFGLALGDLIFKDGFDGP